MTMRLPATEFKSRIACFQKLMQQKELDYLVVYSWKRGQVKYTSGYYPNFVANVAAVLIPAVGEPKMFIRFGFDLERARRESWIDDIRSSGDLKNMAGDLAQEISIEGYRHNKIGVVSGDFVMDEMPYSFFAQLREHLPNLDFIDERGMFMNLRRIKSHAEIEAVKASAMLADKGLAAAKAMVRAGQTERQVVASIEAELRRNGADNHLVVIAAPGSQKLIAPPGERTLLENEDVIVEIAVETGGYWSQVAGVFFTEPRSPEQLEIRDLVYEAYRYTVDQIRPGVTCAEAAQAATRFFQEKGYGDFIEQDFGHGIGLDLPEPPKIEAHDKTVIEPGMVLVVHPALRVPGKGGAFIGGTVIAGEQGAEELHDLSILMGE